MLHKNGLSWRNIIALKDINICDTMSNPNSLFFRPFRELLEFFKGTPRNCPIPAGKSDSNFTFSFGTFKNLSEEMYDHIKKIASFVTPTLFPNGLYKFVMRFFNDEDPIGVLGYATVEFRIAMNDEDF